MFISSFVCVCVCVCVWGGGGGGGGGEGFKISKIQLFYLLAYFRYFFLVVWLFAFVFLSLFYLFSVS